MPISRENQSSKMNTKEAMKQEEPPPQLMPELNNNTNTSSSKSSWSDLTYGKDLNTTAETATGSAPSSDDEWENLFSGDEALNVPNDTITDVKPDTVNGTDTGTDAGENKQEDASMIHRCMSTPEFAHCSHSHLADEDSYIDVDVDTDVDAQSLSTINSVCDDAVLLSHKQSTAANTNPWSTSTNKNTDTNGTMKKVPSFKDIIMLNAQSQTEEEQRQKELVIQHTIKMRKEAAARRKLNRPKVVINPIKRCIKSTGDLRSMVIHEEDDGYDCGYGGGGGGGGMGGFGRIHEDEVLGDTDAMEFYSRKQKGGLNRRNGSKIRPDEAKRKEMIIHKKNAQRRAQQARG